MNRNINSLVLVILFFVFTSACGKKGGAGGGTNEPKEENLQVSLDPNPGSAVAASLNASYDFKLLVNSKMPAAGVKIDITCTKDADNSSVSSQSLTSSSASTSILVNNLQPGILCTVKIAVTSLSLSTNKASLSFKVARK